MILGVANPDGIDITDCPMPFAPVKLHKPDSLIPHFSLREIVHRYLQLSAVCDISELNEMPFGRPELFGVNVQVGAEALDVWASGEYVGGVYAGGVYAAPPHPCAIAARVLGPT